MTDKNADYQPSPQLRQTIREWLHVNSEGVQYVDHDECIEVLADIIPALNIDPLYEQLAGLLNDLGYRTEHGDLWTEADLNTLLPAALYSHRARFPAGVSTLDECDNIDHDHDHDDDHSMIQVLAGKVYVRLPRDTPMDELAKLVSFLDVVMD